MFRSKKEEPDLTMGEKAKLFLAAHWRGVLIVFTPLILLLMLLPFPPKEHMLVAYVLILMAIFWVSECIPLAVTAFMPLAIFPVLGIADTRSVCQCYMNDTVMMFLGSLIISYSVEQSGLHKRLAYAAIQTIGYSHLKLLMAICCVTCFASMWITNTAATTMMVPIVFALLKVFEDQGVITVYEKNADGEQAASDVTSCYFCSTSFSATCGGIGTIVGTGTNLVFKGFFTRDYPEAPEYLSFPMFSAFAVPYMVVLEGCVWLWLAYVFFGFLRPNSDVAKKAVLPVAVQIAARQVIEAEVKKRGPISYWEVMVVVLFGGAMFLFFSRSPQMFLGWGDHIYLYFGLSNAKFVKDSALAMLVGFLMLLFPRDRTFFTNFTAKYKEDLPKTRSYSVLDWKPLNSAMPYAFSFLLGGGFALSKSAKTTGLNDVLGGKMQMLSMFPEVIILLIVIVVVIFITNFASNVAVCTVFTPIAMQLADEIGINPLLYCIASGFASSYCFMIPVGTPSNLIVQCAAKVPTSKMIVCGFGPTITTIFATWFAMAVWAPIVWSDLKEYPTWAKGYKKPDA